MSFTRKYLASIAASVAMVTSINAQQIAAPKTYTAYKTTQQINIDGKDSDEAWNQVAWTQPFIDIEGVVKPKYNTQVKMLWDDTYYYIIAKIDEPHVWGDITERDKVIFHNNDFEVFVDPDGDTHGYYELELNALNTAWDLYISEPYRNPNSVINDWNIDGLKSAVQVNGTLNDASDVDQGWTIEIAIPWSVYKTGYYDKNVPVNKFWRVNFSRVNWDYQLDENGKYQRKRNKEGKILPEYNWVWSPMGVINMHEPEKWGYVFFSTQKPSTKNTFKIPKDDELKWELYKMYRIQNAHFKENGTYLTSLKSLLKTAIVVDGKKIEPKLENHSLGFNLSIKSPFTGKTLIVKENGKFISK